MGAASPDLEIDQALALREPQLAEARAVLRQAQSELKTARLRLQRTDITFPFDAMVLNESADIGDFAVVGSNLGAVADISAFWLEVEVPQNDSAALARDRRRNRRECTGESVRDQRRERVCRPVLSRRNGHFSRRVCSDQSRLGLRCSRSPTR